MWLKSNSTPKWLIEIDVGITSGCLSCKSHRSEGVAFSLVYYRGNLPAISRREGLPRSVAGQRFILKAEGGTSASLP